MQEMWNIEIFYLTNSKNRVVKAFSEKPDKVNDKYKLDSIIFNMKPFTWGRYVELTKACCINGNYNNMDYLLMKEKKIIEGIIDWNIKDESGKKVEITKENIYNLPVCIVETLADKYDSMCYVSKKEKGDLLKSINKYYLSSIAGSGQVSSPPEIIETSLMEHFHWTPQEIDSIPYKKIQELFLTLNQKEASQESAMQVKHGGK